MQLIALPYSKDQMRIAIDCRRVRHLECPVQAPNLLILMAIIRDFNEHPLQAGQRSGRLDLRQPFGSTGGIYQN